MEGDDLICNYKKCRKRLTNVAYVTACSHVFCDEDGTREFNKSTTCPACQTNLSNKFEIVRNNLQPSEQYKSMILAGLKPDVICEIASRAHSFWAYQSHQEKTYQEYIATKSKERCTQIEQYYEQIISRTTTELNSQSFLAVISAVRITKKVNTKIMTSLVAGTKLETENMCNATSGLQSSNWAPTGGALVHYNRFPKFESALKSQLTASKKDVEETKRKMNEISDKLMEKNRQHQKLQSMYESMRRKFITMSSFEVKEQPTPASVYKAQSLESLSASGDHMVNNVPERQLPSKHSTSPKGFDFNPRIGNSDQDFPANQVQKKFSVGLGTPRQ